MINSSPVSASTVTAFVLNFPVPPVENDLEHALITTNKVRTKTKMGVKEKWIVGWKRLCKGMVRGRGK